MPWRTFNSGQSVLSSTSEMEMVRVTIIHVCCPEGQHSKLGMYCESCPHVILAF